jgi:hypothetical protein
MNATAGGHSITEFKISNLAFERRYVIETVVAPRPRHDLVSVPIAQHPAHVFARHPRHRRQVTLVDRVADEDTPATLVLAEIVGEVEQGAR